jgi:murein DD-endopeptidase MepM/ murein hydrolase activator NlpD
MPRCAPPLFLAVLGLTACAHGSERITWESAVPAGPDATGRPASTASASPVKLPFARSLALSEPAGKQIDRALVGFSSKRAAAGRLPPNAAVHGRAWIEVLDAIDAAVLVAPGADDLGAFVRARVMLEVELERDRQRSRPLPQEVPRRLRRALASVDERVDELRMSGAAGTLRPMPRLFEGALVLHAPVMPLIVTSPFGVRQDPIHGGHRFHAGIDVGAPEGSTVLAAADGLVIFAGWQGGHGKHVVLDHGDGVRTHYSHLSDIYTKVGSLLQREQPLGAVGETGRATGPHLHFAVTNAEGGFVDPMEVLYAPFPLPEPVPPSKVASGPRMDQSAAQRLASSSR